MDTQLFADGLSASTEVLAVRYGTVSSPRSEIYHRYPVYGEADAERSMDYFFWVIRDDERTILVDTGFAEATGARRGRQSLISIPDALTALDIDPDDVSHVVLSHFHWDHTGNVDLFPNAQFFAAEQEFTFYTGDMGRRPQFWRSAEESEIEALVALHDGGRLQLVGARESIAPGVSTLLAPGHTPGQLMVMIGAEPGGVVITSDAVHTYEELERDWPFISLVDVRGMYETLELVREMERGGAVVVAGHDPEVTERFPALGGPAAPFAFQVVAPLTR